MPTPEAYGASSLRHHGPPEALRLAALRRYDVLDTPEEPAFDRIAALARDLFETPIAMVSLIDETRQWFKARIGIGIREVPRDDAFCDHTILPAGRDGVFVVGDLAADPRFQDNPYVAQAPHLRFYAGAPVVTPDGDCVGTVSVLSPVPRPGGVTQAQRHWLRGLAAMAADELELRLQARIAREAAEVARSALAAEARLRRAQEAAGVIAFECSLGATGPQDDGEATGSVRALHGLDPDGPLTPEALLAAIHPDHHAELLAAHAELVRQGGTFDQVYRVILPGGGSRWIQARGLVERRAAEGSAPAFQVAGVMQDVTGRIQAEEGRTLLAREVDHRAKNALAVVQAALRLTPADEPAAYAAAIEGRIAALARAHALLAQGNWASAELRSVVEGELQPFLRGAADPVAVLEGPPAPLAPQAVQPLAMVLHELATNATKHGALSRPAGRLRVAWAIEEAGATLAITWAEQGGPEASWPPARRGFGSRLLARTVERQLGGTFRSEWLAGGLRCEFRIPAGRVLLR
jgi:two-component sensor histidine kinase